MKIYAVTNDKRSSYVPARSREDAVATAARWCADAKYTGRTDWIVVTLDTSAPIGDRPVYALLLMDMTDFKLDKPMVLSCHTDGESAFSILSRMWEKYPDDAYGVARMYETD